MNMHCGFNVLAGLQAGETALLFKPWVWALSAKSLPSYRMSFSLPPLWEAGLYVTNRRVLLVGSILRLVTQQSSQWHVGEAPSEDDDVISRVEGGRSSLLGPYLEIVSNNAAQHWYRSAELRLRLFMRHPEAAYRLIAERVVPVRET